MVCTKDTLSARLMLRHSSFIPDRANKVLCQTVPESKVEVSAKEETSTPPTREIDTPLHRAMKCTSFALLLVALTQASALLVQPRVATPAPRRAPSDPERRRDDAEDEDAEEEDADERERRAQRAAAANARADDDASIRPNERTRGKDAARGERTTDRRGARAEVRADLRRTTRGAPVAF